MPVTFGGVRVFPPGPMHYSETPAEAKPKLGARLKQQARHVYAVSTSPEVTQKLDYGINLTGKVVGLAKNVHKAATVVLKKVPVKNEVNATVGGLGKAATGAASAFASIVTFPWTLYNSYNRVPKFISAAKDRNGELISDNLFAFCNDIKVLAEVAKSIGTGLSAFAFIAADQSHWMTPLSIGISVLGVIGIVKGSIDTVRSHMVQKAFERSIAHKSIDGKFESARQYLKEGLNAKVVSKYFKKDATWINERLDKIDQMAISRLPIDGIKSFGNKEKAVQLLQWRLTVTKWSNAVGVVLTTVSVAMGILMLTPAAPIAAPFIFITIGVVSITKVILDNYAKKRFIRILDQLSETPAAA